jgi:hypothetical protein
MSGSGRCSRPACWRLLVGAIVTTNTKFLKSDHAVVSPRNGSSSSRSTAPAPKGEPVITRGDPELRHLG